MQVTCIDISRFKMIRFHCVPVLMLYAAAAASVAVTYALDIEIN